MKTERDPNFYLTHSPIEFLTFMAANYQGQNHIKSVIIPTAPENWIRREHIAGLLKLVNRKDKIVRIISSTSGSTAPFDGEYSSIGKEAQNLIECYRTKIPYPNFDYSSGQPEEKARELKKWRTKFGPP